MLVRAREPLPLLPMMSSPLLENRVPAPSRVMARLVRKSPPVERVEPEETATEPVLAPRLASEETKSVPSVTVVPPA